MGPATNLQNQSTCMYIWRGAFPLFVLIDIGNTVSCKKVSYMYSTVVQYCQGSHTNRNKIAFMNFPWLESNSITKFHYFSRPRNPFSNSISMTFSWPCEPWLHCIPCNTFYKHCLFRKIKSTTLQVCGINVSWHKYYYNTICLYVLTVSPGSTWPPTK